MLNSCEKSTSASPSSTADKFYIGSYYLDYSEAEVQDKSKWHYAAFVYYPDRRTEIYVDGIKKVDFYRYNVNYNYTKFNFGASYNTSFSQYYEGGIDELRISNVARTQKEIQDYYMRSMLGANAKQIIDNFTIGLYHFDETSPSTTFVNSVTTNTPGSLTGTYKFQTGKSGNSIYFDGITGRGECNLNPPESNLTIEFWFKSSNPKGTIIQPYGLFSSDIFLMPY
jgi:hypothetical protein